jgi:hypothetical protein
MRGTRVVAAAGLAIGAPAAAQNTTSDSFVTFALRWSEEGGNGNGVVEPGERVLLALDVSFTNQNGLAHVIPSPNFQWGTIRGFGSGYLDLHGSGGAQGEWDLDQGHGHGVDPMWDVYGMGNGSPTNGGADVLNLQFGQFAPIPEAIVTTNPIHTIWSGLWTPSSYEARTVSFAPAGAAAAGPAIASLLLRTSGSSLGAAFVVPSHLIFEGVAVPIVPTPGALGVIALGVGVGLRRRESPRRHGGRGEEREKSTDER